MKPNNEPSTAQLRNTLRQTFRERRKALSTHEHLQAGLDLLEQYQLSGIGNNAKHVAVYITNDGELSTKPLIDYLWSQNIHVYLPVLHPFCDGYLLFLRYCPNTPMRANGFGIAEPKLDITGLCPVHCLDLIFTPLVAFDDNGNRLGMGGGFYDRTLESISQNNPATKLVGLAHDIQKTLSLPTQAWDIPLPQILTPSQLYTFKETSK